MPADLYSLFNPKSVAIVGASRSKEKVGGIVLDNILKSGFKGKVYPVNSEAGEINGLTAYPDITHLPETPDLAVLAIPAPVVNNILGEIAQKGTKNVVVLSAGFKETGPEGAKLEQEMVTIATQFNLNLLGPNCLGFVNNFLPLNLTFAQTDTNLGNVRFISQSGAIASSIFDWCQQKDLGFSDFITLGNKSTLSENDILSFWQGEKYKSSLFLPLEGASRTRPIGLYLESIDNGQEFLNLAKTVSKIDPIFILKPGKTKAAAKAMQSHTGAIAGEDSVLEVALAQAGVIRCEGLEDFFDFAKAFSWENPPTGPNIAVVSNAGGPAVIIADAIEGAGLTIVEFDDQTRQQLAEHLPRTASIINPVDVLGDALANRYTNAMETVLKQESVHALIVILTPQIMTEIEKTAEAIVQVSKKYQKPIFCSFIGGGHVAKGEEILNRYRIPSFMFPERAVRAVAAMWHWQQWRQTTQPTSTPPPIPSIPAINNTLAQAKSENQTTLSPFEANKLLSLWGISVPPARLAVNIETALDFADSLGYPVVLKLSAPWLVHKTDSGAVKTNITTQEKLKTTWAELGQLKNQSQKPADIFIQKEVVDALEVIVGVKHDPNFGPVLLFGAGGTLAELLEDHKLHLLPIDNEGVKELISTSKISRLLVGYRGHPPYAIDQLADLVVKLTRLAETYLTIAEIEINPVMVTANAAWAVDCRIILSSK